ncbi:helix-turn-helix transcriptional regulator [Pseudoduganella sp. RAF53_2]|uniref:helix-turn-helix transcriptional regulator n=1 Tax=unclassified Pseudoduganella TaxID=2637179 RepID=UPI003F9BB4F1
MYYPTTRVLAVLELLQSQGRLSGADMARRLEVDQRTLRRYIVMLEDLGIPIMSERGRHGGYSLMPGFKLPPMMFNDDEALALSLGLLAARSLGLAEAAPAVASAQAKLERIMPDGLKQRIGSIGDSVHLDLARGRAPQDNAALVVLSAAARDRQRVHINYRASPLAAAGPASGETARDVDPYGLAYYTGFWYLVAHCHLRRGLRTFRLDRVLEARALAQHFERPANFDALAHLRRTIAALPRKFPATVLLKTDLQRAQSVLPDWIGLLEQTPNGVLLHNQSDELEWFARQLAALPFGFEIIGPPELCAVLAQHARQLLSAAQLR